MQARNSLGALALALFAGLAMWGCGEEGVTPKACPPLPLYDVRDPSTLTEEEKQNLSDAYVLRCSDVTLPAAGGTGSAAPPTDGGAAGDAPAAVGGAGG